jgi:hypothetical protein
MNDIITFTISIFALIISLFSIYLTFFNRGHIQMTLPSMIAFGYDLEPNGIRPKIIMRSHIFSTGERGQVIEAIWAELHYKEKVEIFPFWGLNSDDKLVLGGGEWIGKTGKTAWHNFSTDSKFRFMPEIFYTLQIFARIHGHHQPQILWSTQISIPNNCAIKHCDGSEQIWFTLEPQTCIFKPRLESRKQTVDG